MIKTKILEDILQEKYNEAYNQLVKTKEELPAEYKGFVDEHIKSLDIAKSQLQKDINFYSLQSGTEDNVIKSFKIHCAERFLYILAFCQPKRILSYGLTYAEYISPKKQH